MSFRSLTPKELFIRKFAAIAVGNILEYYDFSIFAALADIIAIEFFPPSHSPNYSLLQSFGVFSAAYYARPIGVSLDCTNCCIKYSLSPLTISIFHFLYFQGVLFGWIGDIYGRKKALEISIVSMLISSFAIGCIPGYKYIGDLL